MEVSVIVTNRDENGTEVFGMKMDPAEFSVVQGQPKDKSLFFFDGNRNQMRHFKIEEISVELQLWEQGRTSLVGKMLVSPWADQ